MITVKVSSRGSGKNLDISQYLGHVNRWGECEFHVNTDLREADVWFVSEDVDDDDSECEVVEGGLIFVTAETSWPVGYYGDHPERLEVLAQYNRVYTPHEAYLPNVIPSMPFLPWMINANHGPSINAPHTRDLHALAAMEKPAKAHDLSVFCSTQTRTPEHRMRLRFVEKLKEHFGDRLHWFGNGVNPVDEKWEGIAPYRATIVLENRSTPRVITEKLADAYLGFAYPFYWGAPDVDEFVPPGSLTPIDILDLPGTMAVIEEQLAAGVPEQAVDPINAARTWVLDSWNPYARMAAIAAEVVQSAHGGSSRHLSTMHSADDVIARAISRGGFLGRVLGR